MVPKAISKTCRPYRIPTAGKGELKHREQGKMLFDFPHKKTWPIICHQDSCHYHKMLLPFFSNQWMATTGESFSMCFTSHASMIINTVQVYLAYIRVRKQRAPTFWDTKKQVATRRVGRKWWQEQRPRNSLGQEGWV